MKTTAEIHTEEKIYDAVEQAIAAGMEPKGFIQAAQSAWEQTYSDKARSAAKDFERMLQTRVI